eukprot:g13349.t1
MRSHQQAAGLLLLGCGCVSRARAQEVEGEDAQEVDAFYPTRGLSVENGENDVAVGGIWHNSRLYVAIQTTGFLQSNTNFGEEGTNDIFIEALDADLASEDSLQFGSDGDDLVMAIAADDGVQNDFVIVGSTISEDEHLFETQVNSTGALDWFIATMNSDLEITGSYVNGSEFEDQQATAVVLDPEESGTYYVAGWTWGEYFDDNAGEENDDDAIGYDAWVVKINSLDIEDDLEWSLQFGTVAYDEPSAIVTDGSSVYVVGTVRDDSNVLSATEEEETQSMFVMALDASDGDMLWELDETHVGVVADGSQAHGAVLNEAGTELFVSGNTQGALPDYDGEITESDELFVMSIDTDDGSVNWVWQSQMNATAFGTGGVVMADDGVSPIVSGIAFGNQFNLTFTYWENGSGDMVAAKIDPDNLDDPETLGVAKYFVAAAASNETREDPFALVKDPDVVDGVFMIGGQDGDFGDATAEVEPDPDSDNDGNLSNFLVLKVQLEVLPEEEEPDSKGKDFPYWYVGVPVFAIGGVLFLIAYKWAAASQAAKAKQATMV